MSNMSLCITPTAFTVFDLPVSMALNLTELDTRYHRAQNMVHPDRLIGKTAFEQKMATDHAIRINEAYQSLKNPLSRAGEILKAYGIPIPGNHGQTIQDPSILVDVMEWREQIDECQDLDSLIALEKTLQNKLEHQLSTFSEILDHSEGSREIKNTILVSDISSLYLRFVYLTKALQDLETHPLRSSLC